MTVDRGDDVRRAGARPRRVSAGVLADRMAATLVHHEPGWRLPRLTALARRFNVSAAEIDAAIDDLAARHLLRRLPDGQVYRASPAEYRVPLEGLSGLTSHVDPMGGKLVCKSRQVSWRRAPEDIGRSLGIGPGDPVLTIRCLWTVGGDPAALSATYLPERIGRALPEFASSPFLPPAGPPAGELDHGLPGDGWAGEPDDGLPGGDLAADGTEAGHARALQIEMAPPPPSVARSLRLSAGEPVATVTVSFEDPAAHSPIALTMAMLRPDLFRIVVQATTSDAPAAGLDGFATFWTHATAGWEP
jgi:DNA-binding GntR family transcriptional regulator